MEYRVLGNTGLKVSELGMGCEGFIDKSPEEVREMIDFMEEHHMNAIDLYSSNPKMRKDVGEALKGRREKFVLQLHLCSIWEEGQYLRTRDIAKVKAGFQEELDLLGTDYAEIGMIHYSDSLKDWKEIEEGPVLLYAKELKEKGIIKSIGLSSHNPKVALKAVESGSIEVLMFSVNPCYDLQPGTEDLNELFKPENYTNPMMNMDPERQLLYETCQSKGVGITVMKAFGGGDLLKGDLSPAGRGLTPTQCLHYALTRPGVASIMSGARNIQEMEDTIKYETASWEEKDYATALASFPKISWEGYCMYCGHCAPCPKEIQVAQVMKFLNLAKAQGEVPETVREHYGLLGAKASDCIACGACETRCPFHVKIREHMKEAEDIFGK